VTLRYTQLLRKHRGLTDFLFPLSTAKYTSKAVEKVAFNVVIQSEAKIKNVYSPTHSVEIKRPANTQAIVKWEKTNEVPASDFRLFFDVGDKSVGASVLSYRPEKNEDGYFLLLVSPEIKRSGDEVPRKTVIVVIDRSGSMSGKKIEQARGAVKFVINNLRQGDLFNIIAYDSTVESFKPELQKFDDETRKQALGFAEGIYAGGATNIDGALQAALSQLKDKKQPSYVIFLTDGLPTAGETKETQIVVNARQRNEVRARVFTFGVGYDVNSRLLDKLARECFGQSEYVRPAEDIEESVSRMYSRVGSPVMTDTSLTWDLEGLRPEQGSATNRVYPREIYDLFAGEQLVLVGRYKVPGAAKVTVTGKVNENSQKFDFPAKLIEQSGDETYAFVERLWAMRRVGEIIDEIDLKGKNQELIDELIGLATKHGILTPYTSFLADDDPTGARPRPTPELARRQAGLALEALESESGKTGFDLRKNKADYKAAAKAPAGPPVVYDDAQGEAVVVDTVKYVGKKTFYRRGARWIDSTLSEKEVREAVNIERYSPEYFELITKFGKDVAKYLAIEGNVTVKLGETTYAF
jgi:Ca-activated chloride channel family protein